MVPQSNSSIIEKYQYNSMLTEYKEIEKGVGDFSCQLHGLFLTQINKSCLNTF